MDPSFFLIFWTLTMSDLEVPDHVYEKELKKIDANVSILYSLLLHDCYNYAHLDKFKRKCGSGQVACTYFCPSPSHVVPYVI